MDTISLLLYPRTRSTVQWFRNQGMPLWVFQPAARIRRYGGAACLLYQSHVQCLLPLEKGMRGGNEDNLYCPALHISSWYLSCNFNYLLVGIGAYSEIRLGRSEFGNFAPLPPVYRNVINVERTFFVKFPSFLAISLVFVPLSILLYPIEKVLRLCTVLKKKSFDWQF